PPTANSDTTASSSSAEPATGGSSRPRARTRSAAPEKHKRPAAPEPTAAAKVPAPLPPTVKLDVEALSKNIARMMEEAGKALAAYLRPRETGKVADATTAEEIADVVRTLGHVFEYWVVDPKRTIELQASIGKAYLELWEMTVRRMAGETAPPVIAP